MALSTLLDVVLYFFAIVGYKSFVIELSISISSTHITIAVLRYWYPFIWAGTPISWMISVTCVSRDFFCIYVSSSGSVSPDALFTYTSITSEPALPFIMLYASSLLLAVPKNSMPFNKLCIFFFSSATATFKVLIKLSYAANYCHVKTNFMLLW